MAKNEITTQALKQGYLMLADFSMNDAMSQELNGLDGGFERIKIPAGGNTMFEVPGEEAGETDMVKEFEAVILYHHPVQSFYRDPYAGGNAPPDCGSMDGVSGQGNPGGTCALCPCNEFGSGTNGGKACKSRRRLYLLREGEMFPLLMALPTGSLKGFGLYVKRLLTRGVRTSAVVTKFTLTKAENRGKIAYSQAQFSVARALTPEEAALIAPMSEDVKRRCQLVGFEVDNGADNPFVDPETGEIHPGE